MEFVDAFMLPAESDTAWGTPTDLKQNAPCQPGATLESVEEGTYAGHFKIRVGPISVAYLGQARLLDVDPVARSARVDVSRIGTGSGGTASTDVRAALSKGADGTVVRGLTHSALTGKPAQYGNGVTSEVGTKTIGTFASWLQDFVRDEGVLTTIDVARPVTPSWKNGSSSDALGLLESAGAAQRQDFSPRWLSLFSPSQRWPGSSGGDSPSKAAGGQ